MLKNRLMILLLVILLLPPACAPKKHVHSPEFTPDWKNSINDLREFPQDLGPFAKNAGADKRILSQAAQAEMDASFNRIYFGPWHMTKTSIARREVSSPFGRARGYKSGSLPWTQPEWDEMRRNANIGAFPGMARSAITLRRTDLRELPTHEPRFSEPTSNVRENPFDYFQYSALEIGMPLLVAHSSLDGRWVYVECPIAGGWVDARDIAWVDEPFKTLWQGAKFAALTKDGVSLPGAGPGGKDAKAGIGAILPLASRASGGSLRVLIPLAGQGAYAKTGEITLPAAQAAPKPLPLTPGRVAEVGNAMMGQPYGWGGMLGERDCSSMIRDLFAPFGVWLPRNSAAQAKRGALLSLSGLDQKAKEALILKDGEPFFSLLGMRGHIALYIGAWKGRPAIFHNVWGMRIVRDGDDNERHVIGHAVVTSITPGMELRNLYRPVTFVDRLRSLTRLGR